MKELKNNTTIQKIKNRILENKQTAKIFTHHKQKYPIEELLKYVLVVLNNGVSFRELGKYTKIHWNTIYKFFIKLTIHNLLDDLYEKSINKYLTEINNTSKYLFIDSTLIPNKLGVDKATITPQLKKHKSSKVSFIVDEFGIPIDCEIYESSFYDAKIANIQIDDIVEKYPILCSGDKTVIGDAAYDSNHLRNKINELKIGKLLTPKNKRNIKDTKKFANLR